MIGTKIVSRIATMKPAICLLLLTFFSLSTAPAEDKPIKIDKSTVDKAKDMLDKVVNEAKDAAEKAGDKGRELWARTKENLRLSREEYLKKATSGLKTMELEIAEISESGSAMFSRDYYKMRMDALKLHLDYCKRDFERLQATDSEEAFRVRQKGFDRGLGFLGDNIELAAEEAGL
jgi:hypothetical protein